MVSYSLRKKNAAICVTRVQSILGSIWLNMANLCKEKVSRIGLQSGGKINYYKLA